MIANDRKSFIFSLLKQGRTVEIVNLTSAKGQQVNGRLGAVAGNLDGGRFPVLLRHLTGESEKLSIRPQNLDPFVKDEQLAKEENRLAFINYSTDGKVREGHGRLLDQTLMLLRFYTNIHQGCLFYPNCRSFDDFYRIPRGDPPMLHCNAALYTNYNVKPSNFESDGVEELSVLDETIKCLLESEDQIEKLGFGSMAAYPADGAGGKLIVRNMIRSMRAWDTERITGSFWLAKITKSGTLLVRNTGGGDIEGPDSLGDVYLVKGMGSKVGENIPPGRFPVLADMTFLPMYHFLVYDGLMLCSEIARPSTELKRRIHDKIESAIRNETIVYHGESASKGLWDSDPPIYEIPIVEDTAENEEFERYHPSEAEIDLARQILFLAKEASYKSKKEEGMPILIARRFDYVEEKNPNHLFSMMYNVNGYPVPLLTSMFYFENWPSYNLHELLNALLESIQKHNIIPNMFWIDDKEKIQPLKKVLHVASELEQFEESFLVEWYIPPSEEEESLQGRYSGRF